MCNSASFFLSTQLVDSRSVCCFHRAQSYRFSLADTLFCFWRHECCSKGEETTCGDDFSWINFSLFHNATLRLAVHPVCKMSFYWVLCVRSETRLLLRTFFFIILFVFFISLTTHIDAALTVFNFWCNSYEILKQQSFIFWFMKLTKHYVNSLQTHRTGFTSKRCFYSSKQLLTTTTTTCWNHVKAMQKSNSQPPSLQHNGSVLFGNIVCVSTRSLKERRNAHARQLNLNLSQQTRRMFFIEIVFVETRALRFMEFHPDKWHTKLMTSGFTDCHAENHKMF